MATKEEILRELYPEDLFHYADGLTLGEAEVLQETRRLIEKHLRPVINEYWEKADFPFEQFYEVAKGAQIITTLNCSKEEKENPNHQNFTSHSCTLN